MSELWQGLVRAIELIITLDPEVMEITGRSLGISVSACLFSALMAVPLASLIHFYSFPGKRLLISTIQTFFSLPTVLVGLLVFLFFSRSGMLGGLNLMFTPTLMVIGQTILVLPLMIGLIISALNGIGKGVTETALALGASQVQTAGLLLKEARYAVVTAVIMGFGRAISEVGLALMIGGNIRGYTRTLTTSISLQTNLGEIELSLALGVILLVIALVINILLNRLQQR
jgi:tungstate transport system permease protein